MIKWNFLFIIALLTSPLLRAEDFQKIPIAYKTYSNAFAFTYSYDYMDKADFRIYPTSRSFVKKIQISPKKYIDFPVDVSAWTNPTYSPDSSKIAYTMQNNLYVYDISSKKTTQLTTDGDDLILNGYASWVYYEEIFGRASNYKAFWWSPDSEKIAYYRFDNTQVPMFPIYSAQGQSGYIRRTHYPKAGQTNPKVRIALVNLQDNSCKWAGFNEDDDQYFGTPFWSADSQSLFVSRMPRLQNTLELFRLSVKDAVKECIYTERYKTWINWIEGMFFGKKGLYMVRDFETDWQQLYYLSYDGKVLKRLTEGKNWRMQIEYIDESKEKYYFTAERDSRFRKSLYLADKKGIKALTDISMNAANILFSEDGNYFLASLSNYTTPTQIWLFNRKRPNQKFLIADMKTESFSAENYNLPKLVKIKARDGMTLYATVVYPKNFDPSKKYPVHVDLYGGPDTPLVRELWRDPARNDWWAEHGIIQVVADCRAAGHNGRAGLDMIYRRLGQREVEDFVDWARYFQTLAYVKKDKIAVEGFSFGGTMAASLVMLHPDEYHYGIAGGGVYDWALYDSHYTERFMDTPQNNPEGYKTSKVLSYVDSYKAKYSNDKKNKGVEPIMLKITHGTADDNVHLQNSLQLIDALQDKAAKFEFMIYPDEFHGYRGNKSWHFLSANREFYLKYLLEELK